MFKSFTEKRPTSITPEVFSEEMMDKINELLISVGITTVYWKGGETNNTSKAFFMNNLKFSEYDAINFENWNTKYKYSKISSDNAPNSSYCKTKQAIGFTVDGIKYAIMCGVNGGTTRMVMVMNVITQENELSYMDKYYACSYFYRDYLYASNGAQEYCFYPFYSTELPTTYTVLRDENNKLFMFFMKTKGGNLDKRWGGSCGHCGIENLGPIEMENNLMNFQMKGRMTKKIAINTREEETVLLNPLTSFTSFDTETNIDLNNGKVYLQDCMVGIINYGILGISKGVKFSTIQGTRDLEAVSISGHTYYKLVEGLYWRSV